MGGNFFKELLKKSNSCSLSPVVPQETQTSSSSFKSRLEEIPSSSSSMRTMSSQEYQLWEKSLVDRVDKCLVGFMETAEEIAGLFNFVCTLGLIFCIGGSAYYLYDIIKILSDRRRNNSNNGVVGTNNANNGVVGDNNNGVGTNNNSGGNSGTNNANNNGVGTTNNGGGNSGNNNGGSSGNNCSSCHCNRSSSSSSSGNKED